MLRFLFLIENVTIININEILFYLIFEKTDYEIKIKEILKNYNFFYIL
jgi:hypothetical protein